MGQFRNADRGLIARCTEIELFIGPNDIPVPFFPTTAIRTPSAVAFALGEWPITFNESETHQPSTYSLIP
ncbi:MAG: hypothetical protein BMS9Abin20_1074 [Acidimicrobiia bacterium]|nr:MAG: hypothetical protein BMS9Abin20_1074 [Acidimicrobiia bacterium]